MWLPTSLSWLPDCTGRGHSAAAQAVCRPERTRVLSRSIRRTGANSIRLGYYHLRPNDSRLFWALPITVAFMGLLAAMTSERLSVPIGVWLLPVLVGCGSASLWYWRGTVEVGNRDLRPYILIQFYPLLAILLLLWMFEPRYTRGYDFLIALAFYVAAKIFEVADRPIFAATGNMISGHTLKHIFAALGGYWLARMVTKRGCHLRTGW